MSINYSTLYQVLSLLLDYFTRFISNSKNLLNILISSKLSKSLYLTSISKMTHYIIQDNFLAIKLKAKTI